MNMYMFEVAHGYEILKGYVSANSKDEAKKKILNEEWDDIIDDFEIDEFTEGYEVIGIWE